MNKEDIIYDLVKNIKEDQDNIKEDVTEIKSDLRLHSVSLERYNDLLNVHIAGVDTLKKLHLDNAKRIELLEEPVRIDNAIADHHKKLIKTLSKMVGVIATIIGIFIALKDFKH